MEAYEGAYIEVVTFDQDVIVASGTDQEFSNTTFGPDQPGDYPVNIVIGEDDPWNPPVNYTNYTNP